MMGEGVDRLSLQELLDREGVNPDAYDLDGRPVEDGLTLDLDSGMGRVLYTERGHSRVIRGFTSEDAACNFLAEELVSCEWNLFKVVASSPYGGVSEPEFLAHWLGSVGMAWGVIPEADVRFSYRPGRHGGTVICLGIRRTFLRARDLDH